MNKTTKTQRAQRSEKIFVLFVSLWFSLLSLFIRSKPTNESAFFLVETGKSTDYRAHLLGVTFHYVEKNQRTEACNESVS